MQTRTPIRRSLRPLICLALAAGLGCTSSSDNNSERDATTSEGDDASSQGGDAAQEDAAQKPRDAATGDASHDGAAPHDAAVDSGQDAAVAPKPIIATYVYQGGNGGDPYPFKTFKLNRSTGALTQVGGNKDLGPSPTYIAPTANGKFLYVANESYAAGVTAASIGNDGTPSKIETQQVQAGSSELNAMVFTSLSPNQDFVLAANYYGGRVVSFPIENSGALGAPASSFPFASDAQTHSVRVDKTGTFAFAANRNANTIGQLKFNSNTGQLAANDPVTIRGGDPDVETPAGPRHVALHPSKPYLYVANEDNSTLSVYSISNAGLLTELQTTSALANNQADGAGDTGAHALVHPSGKFVYMSNRGQNNIAVFSIAANGTVTLIENESTRGTTPRNFDIDSEGELMVVANQGSGSLAVFSIAADGKLSALGDLVTGLMEPNAVAIVNVR
ncbi:MAG: beta-propeller fold lactonase family protein [Myxococcales bacterium]